jgi:hypothetical protein
VTATREEVSASRLRGELVQLQDAFRNHERLAQAESQAAGARLNNVEAYANTEANHARNHVVVVEHEVSQVVEVLRSELVAALGEAQQEMRAAQVERHNSMTARQAAQLLEASADGRGQQEVTMMQQSVARMKNMAETTIQQQHAQFTQELQSAKRTAEQSCKMVRTLQDELKAYQNALRPATADARPTMTGAETQLRQELNEAHKKLDTVRLQADWTKQRLRTEMQNYEDEWYQEKSTAAALRCELEEAQADWYSTVSHAPPPEYEAAGRGWRRKRRGTAGA